MSSHYTILNRSDAETLKDQAIAVTNQFAESECANSSGKFFNNYRCWHFHKDSSLPLINTAKKLFESEFKLLNEIYRKDFRIDFIILNYVEDSSQEICLWHKDGYFFDGQMHLTILGNGSIEVEVANEEVDYIFVPNGTVWYLNGSQFRHRIRPTLGPRLEICAPVNQRREDVEIKMNALSHDEVLLVDGANLEWTKLRREQATYVLRAIEKGKASNSNVASFSVDPRND